MNPVPPPSQFDRNSVLSKWRGVPLRRVVFAALFVATFAALSTLMYAAFSASGLNSVETVMLGLFMVMLPWTIVGFWNAVIGLFIMRLANNPAGYVNPAAAQDLSDRPIHADTAILLCVRNEAPDRIVRNLDKMIDELVSAGASGRFHAYVLSDSSFPEIIHDEQLAFDQLARRWSGRFQITYRRRLDNQGFKAGNIRDFCDRWGDEHDYALVLDADSVMTGRAIMRLVRMMQADPGLGIAQSLVVGLPSTSLFTRIFQFGMRLGMRSYTIGSAWWQGDCGPYWGHNALIRLAPFRAHCHLPELPGKGPLSGCILSHDQVEAALMRRAGYSVRTIADEKGSWEENPPNLLEFIRRDLRWCHGNMQYLHLLRMPGLKPVSRIQLVLAILMFLSAPAWIAFMLLATVQFATVEDPASLVHPHYGIALFVIILSMVFAPKLATIVDVLSRPSDRRSFGGGLAILCGAFVEIIFSMMLAPVMAIAVTVFLIRLMLGQKGGWSAQERDNHLVPFDAAFRRLWPQTLFGIVGLIWLFDIANASILFVLPVIVGPLLAVPFAVATSWPTLGALACRFGLWRIPEEKRPDKLLLKLDLEPYRLIYPNNPGLDLISISGSSDVMEQRLAPAEIVERSDNRDY